MVSVPVTGSGPTTIFLSTAFELLYRMKACMPSFHSQDVQHLHFGESFSAERLQILKQAWLIAQQHTADKWVP